MCVVVFVCGVICMFVILYGIVPSLETMRPIQMVVLGFVLVISAWILSGLLGSIVIVPSPWPWQWHVQLQHWLLMISFVDVILGSRAPVFTAPCITVFSGHMLVAASSDAAMIPITASTVWCKMVSPW